MLAKMELRQLRYFVAVAEEKNITRAAEKIFLSQPALSRQIKALEEEIGQLLLERSAHSFRLTPAGETFLPKARELLQQADRLSHSVRVVNPRERLRIGYAPSMAENLLPRALKKFMGAHPRFHVELCDLCSSELLERVENGKLDLVLTVQPDHRIRTLMWTPLIRSSWHLVVNREHPLAAQSKVSPAEVARERLLAFNRRDYPEYWEMIAGWLRKHRQNVQPAGEYDSLSSLTAAIVAGMGVAVILSRVARVFPKSLVLKGLSAEPKPQTIAVGYRKDRAREKSVVRFIKELRRAVNEKANA